MSGHSKWHSIKRQKNATDQKRGKIFTKLAKGITVAAREGGGDPEMNFKLRLAIQKAKAANMPKDNIERAIARGIGDTDGVQYEELLYEGLGPEKIGVVVAVLTDNKNRAVSDLKYIFSKHGGALAANGAVMWQFDHRGVILSEITELTEEIELLLLDSGALDFSITTDGLEIITEPNKLDEVKTFVEKNNIPVAQAELQYIPKETKQVENKAAWERFIDALDDADDVDSYYTAADYES